MFPEKRVQSPDQAPICSEQEPAAAIAHPDSDSDSGPWDLRRTVLGLKFRLQTTELPEGGVAEQFRLQFLIDSKAEGFPLHRLSLSHPGVSTKAP